MRCTRLCKRDRTEVSKRFERQRAEKARRTVRVSERSSHSRHSQSPPGNSIILKIFVDIRLYERRVRMARRREKERGKGHETCMDATWSTSGQSDLSVKNKHATLRERGGE